MSDQYRKLGPRPEPDWFWLTSGGVDSVAAFLLTKDAIAENFRKTAVVAYLDTRVGNRLQRLYVEELCDRYDVQMWSLRTHEKFEDRVAARGKYDDRDDAGAPGGAQHSNVQNELKGRQRDVLERGYDELTYVTGIRAEESDARAAKPKGEANDGVRYVKPAYELSKRECVRIILEHDDCPINPIWIWPGVIGDCGCLANGDPSELDATEDRFPWFAQRLREYEEAADADGLRGTLGWDGLTANEKSARRNGQRQMNLCGEGCQRQRDPVAVRAFRTAIHGTRSEAIDVLETADSKAAV